MIGDIEDLGDGWARIWTRKGPIQKQWKEIRALQEQQKGRKPPPFYVIGDSYKKPFKIMAGPRAGEMCESRCDYRNYLKAHGFEEVGNEKDYFFRDHGMTEDNPRIRDEKWLNQNPEMKALQKQLKMQWQKPKK